MTRFTPERLRAVAATLAVLLGLMPIVGDVHFATTPHRWCEIHERLEATSDAHVLVSPHQPGVSERRALHGQAGQACLVELATNQAARPTARATLLGGLPALATALPPALPCLGRSVLDDAPTRGPPAA